MCGATGYPGFLSPVATLATLPPQRPYDAKRTSSPKSIALLPPTHAGCGRTSLGCFAARPTALEYLQRDSRPGCGNFTQFETLGEGQSVPTGRPIDAKADVLEH